MSLPVVSVLLPVYNGERYLEDAVESILSQSFRDFELIVVNDGSTDRSREIVLGFTDPRIRYFEQENAGLSATLNRAVSLARGRYLARQDSDDVSFPERFAKQVAFLDAHPECGMVGTWAEIWEEGSRSDRAHRHPACDGVLRFELLFNNPFVHSSMMLRREAVEAVGGYLDDRSRQLPEDYELWSRISRRFRVANIPEFLHVYRETGGSICRENWDRLMQEVVAVSAGNIAHATAASPGDRDVMGLASLANAMPLKGANSPRYSGVKRVFRCAVRRMQQESPQDAAAIEAAALEKWRCVRFRFLRVLIPRPLLDLLIRPRSTP